MPYPAHTQRTIVKAWIFRSSSGTGTYETLLYNDQTTSCNCPGWTRRVFANGVRMCRHTRSVDMNIADQEALTFINYFNYSEFPVPQPQTNQRKESHGKERKNGSREVGQLGKRKLL